MEGEIMRSIIKILIAILAIFLVVLNGAARAATEYTDATSWEEALPDGASITEVTFSGTPGETVASGGSYIGIANLALVYGNRLYYSGDGNQVCIEPDGVNTPRFEIFLLSASTVFGMQVSGVLSGVEIGGYDDAGMYEYALVSSVSENAFRGVIFDFPKVELALIAQGMYDTICVGPLLVELDADGDGYTATAGDCDDADPTVSLDNDCNGSVDNDGDGWAADNGDCDDEDVLVYPGAEEVCDNLADDDCNGAVDEVDECLGETGTVYLGEVTEGSGCACSSSTRKPAGALPALLLIGVALRRRRAEA